mmetsp:Transcript_68485/g.191912  ORF Transcript_68485/g.191912 Transcript_68485/m.191912 type:complete len:297 (+) Transcript_68485:1747-2637(+)
MLSQPVEEPGLREGRQHLAFEALVPQAPQYVSVLRPRIPEDDRLPRALVPITLSPCGNVDSATEDAGPQPSSKRGLLVERRGYLVHVQLADREHPAGHLDLGSALKVPLERLHLQRRAHEDHAQVRPALQQVPHEDHVEVRELVALVHLVEDDVRDVVELRVLQHPLAEDAQRREDQLGVRRLSAEGHLVPHVHAQRLAALLGDSLRQRRRGELPRLHHEDPRLGAGVQDELRHLGGLAAARLAHEQAHLAVPDLLDDVLPLLEARKLLPLLPELLVRGIGPPLLDGLLHDLERHR